MDELLIRLLEARSAVIADIAPDGAEMLVRWDDTGSMQIYRLPVGGGELTQMTFLSEPVSAARYVGGTHDAVVAVDHGGDENFQLWRLDLRNGDLCHLSHQGIPVHRRNDFNTKIVRSRESCKQRS